MSDSIDTIRTELWEKMRGKTREKGKRYRDNFVSAHLSANVAAQIQTMRETRGWLQKDLGERADMSPARISVMENPSYENHNVKTLKRLASAFDVALVIKFVPFNELVSWVASVSPEKLNVASFDEDKLVPEEAQRTTVAVKLAPVPESEWWHGQDNPHIRNAGTAAATLDTRSDTPAEWAQRDDFLPSVPRQGSATSSLFA